MSDKTPRRRDDIELTELKVMFQDFIDRYERDCKTENEWRASHDASAVIFRDDIDKRLKPVEDWVKNAKWSWQLMAGLVAFAAVLVKLWDWVKSHVR